MYILNTAGSAEKKNIHPAAYGIECKALALGHQQSTPKNLFLTSQFNLSQTRILEAWWGLFRLAWKIRYVWRANNFENTILGPFGWTQIALPTYHLHEQEIVSNTKPTLSIAFSKIKKKIGPVMAGATELVLLALYSVPSTGP